MATKDLDTSENKDRNKNLQNQPDLPATANDDEETKASDKAEVKNAHATGDGSFGRSESSLPDSEGQKKQGSSTY